MKKTFLALAAACLLANVASAADFTTSMKDMDGKPITVCPQDKPDCGKELTLGEVAIGALNTSFADERDITGEEKFKRGELALRIHKDQHLGLTAEETATVKKLVGKLYTPLVVYQADKLLDPAAAAKK
jgi:hypothetical protein